VTDFGHRTAAGSRAELGYTGGGPQWLVSELGVFDYDSEGRARLQQLFPDVTVEDVLRATGFTVEVSPDLSPVPPPSSVELAVVRSIDPLGVRRSEFDPREIERTFELVHGAS
jgi:glutaconate CoA-transferase, subunit B